jgi:hypothetical protein
MKMLIPNLHDLNEATVTTSNYTIISTVTKSIATSSRKYDVHKI